MFVEWYITKLACPFDKIFLCQPLSLLHKVLWWELLNQIFPSAGGVMREVESLLWIWGESDFIPSVLYRPGKIYSVFDLLEIQAKATSLADEVLKSMGVYFPSLHLGTTW